MAETMAYNDDHDAQVDPFTDMKIRYVKYRSSQVCPNLEYAYTTCPKVYSKDQAHLLTPTKRPYSASLRRFGPRSHHRSYSSLEPPVR